MSIESHRCRQAVFPGGQTLIRFAQQLPDQATKGLDEGAVGHIALELIKLAVNKVPFLAHARLMHLMHQHRFTHPGVA